MENYNIYVDKAFRKSIRKNKIAENTIVAYANATEQFCKVNNKPLNQLIEEMKDGEYGEIIGNKIKPYDVENSITKEYLEEYDYYLQEEGYKETSIKTKITNVRTILKAHNIILPKQRKYEKNTEKLILLKREHIRYILTISNTHLKALTTCLASMGLRISDIVKFTIGDFMYATRKFHNCTTVEEFLEKAPKDMIGYWELTPIKTKRIGLECAVCNSPESSNFMLESLRQRQKSIQQMNKKYGRNDKLEITDALFTSRKKRLKGHLNTPSITHIYWEKNKKLQEKLKRELEQKLKNEEISLTEYKKELKKLPTFHAHALRHYFISVLNAYCSNKTIALKMEAHKSDVQSHEFYIGQSEEIFDEEMIREHYEKLIPYLTFNKTIDPEEYQKYKEQEKLLKLYQEDEKRRIKEHEEYKKRFEKILAKFE